MINFLNNIALTSDKLHQETEFLIPNFLAKRMITMFYADGGNGKSWLSYSVASYLCRKNLAKMVYYIDLDNPIDALKDRNVEELLINKYDNFKYIHRSDLDESALETLERLASKEYSKGHAYEEVVFIIDSVRNIANMRNDEKAMHVMNLFMDIREAGATVMFIAHSNKDGKNYEGSNNMKNSADAMFKLKLLHKVVGESVTIELDAEKERAGVRSCDWHICTKTLKMSKADPLYSKMSEYEREFVNNGKDILKRNPRGLGQTEFLSALGFEKTDKTARDTLERFIDKFWNKHQEKKGKPITYTALI